MQFEYSMYSQYRLTLFRGRQKMYCVIRNRDNKRVIGLTTNEAKAHAFMLAHV